jgi:adenine phosphoribosyltransferase
MIGGGLAPSLHCNPLDYPGRLMNHPETYTVNIGGMKRTYPIVPLADDILGVYFFMPGDVELIEHAAALIAERLGDRCDTLLVPEVGGVPLAHAVARLLNLNYLVARKAVKPYMADPIVIEVQSITTPGKQTLVVDGRDVPHLKGKRVGLIDDVISTTGTMQGLATLTERCEAKTTALVTLFLEGDTTQRDLEETFGCPVISFDWLPVYPIYP